VVRQKLKTMVTDPARVRRTDPGDPDKCPVGDLHKVFSTPETLAKVYEGCRSAGIGCIECKGWAADSLVKILEPIQERRADVDDRHVRVRQTRKRAAADTRRTSGRNQPREVKGLVGPRKCKRWKRKSRGGVGHSKLQ
jgi:tryptophanyl-tRNA synthetase